MKKIKPFHLAVITAIAILAAILNPLQMDFNQRILLSCLIFTVAIWATEAIHKSIACVFLLLSFFIFGKTPPLEILKLTWSGTILLIVTTTLLSVGIMKTGIVHRYVHKLFQKNSSGVIPLMLLPYIFGVVLVFLIPQAFARVIIIGTIFSSLIHANNEEENKAKQALIFNGFIAITMTYMFFVNGDIVLNQAALNFAGDEVKQTLSFGKWFTMMLVPTLVTCGVAFLTTYLVFKKDLSAFKKSMIAHDDSRSNEFSKFKQQIGVVTMAVIILFWMTQSMHSIQPWIIALVGVIVMFAAKILDKSDLKSVNLHLILFLITVFNIGKVLGQSGITGIIFEHLKQLIPNTNSATYLLIIAAIVMILHLCIGSSVATMSVVLPILIPLTQSLGYQPEVITLMTYAIVNIHFLLPFHHATVMIGTAREYYPERSMFRFGLPMTIITFVLLALVYFPYWRMLGAL